MSAEKKRFSSGLGGCASPRLIVLALILTGFSFSDSFSQTTAQWRGKNRDGIYKEDNLTQDWNKKAPSLLFSVDGLGEGHSSPVVSGNRIYITGSEDGTGYLFAFDLKGKQLWKSSYGSEWHKDYPGVRATPTVDGNRIYVESGTGTISSFEPTGKIIWSVDMAKTFGAKLPKWGHNESVVIQGNLLFCTPGGSKAGVAALDKTTGKTIWTTKIPGETSGYCSPVMVTHKGRAILVTMLSKSIIGLDPKTGELLWQQPHPTRFGVNANTPIYHNGNIIYFSGYGEGAAMISLSDDGSGIKKVWANNTFDTQIGAAVLIGDNLYGSGHNSRGWHCLDVNTGKIKYSSRDIKRGCIISDGKQLYLYSETGALSLVSPGEQGFSVKGSIDIREGKGPHWAHPVISDGKLYVRHGEALLAYNIAM